MDDIQYVLAVFGGVIVVLVGLLAWRDRRTRRGGGQINYPTSKALDARRRGPDQPGGQGLIATRDRQIP